MKTNKRTETVGGNKRKKEDKKGRAEEEAIAIMYQIVMFQIVMFQIVIVYVSVVLDVLKL